MQCIRCRKTALLLHIHTNSTTMEQNSNFPCSSLSYVTIFNSSIDLGLECRKINTFSPKERSQLAFIRNFQVLIDNTIVICYRESDTRFSTSVSPGPLSITLGSFCIFSKICGDYRKWMFISGVKREKFGGILFFKFC